jgi:hypothetical protein
MATYRLPPRLSLEQFLPWVALIILFTFSYAKFFQVPYTGFAWNVSDGQILKVFGAPNSNGVLRAGDRIISIGGVPLDHIRDELTEVPFAETRPGEIVQLLIERGGLQFSVAWTFPSLNHEELLTCFTCGPKTLAGNS